MTYDWLSVHSEGTEGSYSNMYKTADRMEKHHKEASDGLGWWYYIQQGRTPTVAMQIHVILATK